MLGLSSERASLKKDVIGYIGVILLGFGVCLAFSGWYAGFTASIMPGEALLVIGILLVAAWAVVRKRS